MSSGTEEERAMSPGGDTLRDGAAGRAGATRGWRLVAAASLLVVAGLPATAVPYTVEELGADRRAASGEFRAHRAVEARVLGAVRPSRESAAAVPVRGWRCPRFAEPDSPT